MRAFLSGQTDIIAFVYGLSFVFLSAVCVSFHNKRKPDIPWHWLALFGAVYGVKAWLDMLAGSLGDNVNFAWCRDFLTVAAVALLLEFGRSSRRRVGDMTLAGWVMLPLLASMALGGSAALLVLRAAIASVVVFAVWYYIRVVILPEGDVKKSRDGSRFAIFWGSIFVLFLAASCVFVNWTGEQKTVKERAKILYLAQQMAPVLDIRQVQALTVSSADLESAAYQYLKNQLQSLRKVDPGIRFVYLMRRVEGRVLFLADSEAQGSKDESPPGQAMESVPAELVGVFDSGKAVVEGPSGDRWGTWLSGYAPLNDPRTGALAAVLGVDQDARDYVRHIALERIKTIVFLGLMCVVVILMLVYYQRFSGALSSHEEVADPFMRWGTLGFVVLFGITVSGMLFLREQEREKEAFKAVFVRAAAGQVNIITQALGEQVDRLESIRHHFETVPVIDPDQFSRFVKPIMDDVPLQSLEWVAKEQFDRFASDPAQRAAMDKSRDEGMTVAGAPVALGPLSGNKNGFQVFVPVFMPGAEPHSIAERRRDLRGFIRVVYRGADFLKAAYTTMPEEGLACLIEDPQAPPSVSVLYRHQVPAGTVDWFKPMVRYEVPVLMANREWRIGILPGSAFIASSMSRSYVWILPFGVLVTCLAALFLNLLMMGRSRLEVLVRERTSELSREKEALARNEEKLEQAMQAKSNFVSMVSHELRTPLTAIKSSVDILETEAPGKLSGDQKTFLARVRTNIDRLLRLVNDILDLSKFESGKMTMNLAPVRPEEVINEVVAMQGVVARAMGIGLAIDIQGALPVLLTDRDRLLQVFNNLISNALKFTRRGSVLVSAFSEDGKAVVFCVRDTGDGIKPEYLEKIFEKFYQAGRAADQVSGTGLGLAICKEIVERLGGRIWVESKPGVGSAFFFTIPLRHNKRILVVDDDRATLAMIKGILKGENKYEIELAADGFLAGQKYLEFEPHLIILDIGLPKLNGLEVCAQVKNGPRGRETKILMISSSIDEMEHNIREAGADDMMRKPVDRAQLLLKVSQLI
ncbi:MAG: ATP-binding protein [Candidatus Omnitrophota bacterium]